MAALTPVVVILADETALAAIVIAAEPAVEVTSPVSAGKRPAATVPLDKLDAFRVVSAEPSTEASHCDEPAFQRNTCPFADGAVAETTEPWSLETTGDGNEPDKSPDAAPVGAAPVIVTFVAPVIRPAASTLNCAT